MREKLPLSKLIIKAPAILFAGAGASVPLGLLTAQAFWGLIKSSFYSNTVSEKVLGAVLDLLSERKHDIEGLLETLSQCCEEGEKRTNLITHLQTLGIFNGSDKELQLILTELNDMVLRKIVEHYSDVDKERAKYLYFWLILILKGFQEDWQPIPVFTTNYDWAFERMAESWRKSRLIDGFRPSISGMNWQPEIFHRLKGSKKFDAFLFKLHGSTSWFQQPSGAIQKLAYAERNTGGLRSVLIYPRLAMGDFIRQEPYTIGYQYLEACLSVAARLCVVIGFSFRDEPINNIFGRALSANPKLHLIIVDPYPDKNRIYSVLKTDESSVTFVEEEFKYYGLNLNARLRESIESHMPPKCIWLGGEYKPKKESV